jgi:hypothetical protein
MRRAGSRREGRNTSTSSSNGGRRQGSTIVQPGALRSNASRKRSTTDELAPRVCCCSAFTRGPSPMPSCLPLPALALGPHFLRPAITSMARRPTSLPNGAATASILHRVTPTSFLHARRHLLSPRLPPYVSPSGLRPTSNRQRAAATYTPRRPFRADLATAPPPPSFLSPASKGSTAAEEAAIGEERRRWGLGSEARIGDVGRSRFSHLSGGTS